MPPITGSNILVIGGYWPPPRGMFTSRLPRPISPVWKRRSKIDIAVPNAQIEGYTVDVSVDDAESRLEKLFAEVTTAKGRPLDHIVYTRR
ncbi:short chain dehydrogenase/reductase family oxidoreductase [Penicillium bovifimosum]|uniref:Short chain dehydrogenase/reductase family oxidoreductase n=1 Tax=Penicillium bovifimosum TaxID=126998 RepID=A0A9W9HFD0_9EURO|nr:short chain dehydrogenase/reductase family oxidoreductase [Penicillium bovifimosum]KAJ5145786.1 short chain dehydrogenase/reductase family oxidoreductase [Penicillium bovifimosum]